MTTSSRVQSLMLIQCRPQVTGPGPEAKDARLSLMYKIVHDLILVEAIKYVNLQRNLIKLQQILANKKYYEILFFPCTVKDSYSLPKTILAADSLKAFKAGVVSVDHHLPY